MWLVTGRLPTNAEVADRLALIGELLEIEGAERHRILAYRRGAARIRANHESVAEMALAGRATELPDIGHTLQAKIAELAGTGRIAALERLLERVPVGLAEVARLDGLGPARARTLWRELGITSMDDLREAASAGRLRGLPGLGPKTTARLEEQLAEAPEAAAPEARVPLGRVLPLADQLARDLATAPGVHRVAVAGSARRGVESVGDVDLVASAEPPEAAARALLEHRVSERVLARGPARTVVLTHAGLRVELRTGPPETFGDLLQHCTGSAGHNLRLRELAARRGLSVSEHGITGPDGEVQRHEDEEGVYAALGLPVIPPELREDDGELERAASGSLPRLIDEADLRGDLHMHTDWSDGRETIEAMVAEARARGYEYVAISDHSQSRGLDPERVARQWERIEELNATGPGIRVLKATEVDILADGRLDFEDDLLAGFDFVTASVHSGFRQSSARLTERLLRAIESPHVDAIGHPTGRMMGRRRSYEIDLDRVLERAAATGTFLEINAQPLRLDLDDRTAREAIAAGVRLTIGSDAHTRAGLGFMRYGLLVARRACARREDIVNTRPFAEVQALRSAPTRPAGAGA
jgi:DNA polymerase (family 10)